METFAGKVAVVTGGASGVGRCLCDQLVAAGADVIVADIDKQRLDQVAEELNGSGPGSAARLEVDVTKESSVDALAEQVFAKHGRVNLLFNNAGVGLGEAQKKIWSIPINDWNWGMDVNVLGVVHGIKAFVPRMLESGEEGVVINTSSSNGGLRSLPNTPVYAATKAAVTSISEVLYQQLLREGNRVKAAILFPGPHTVNTGILASRLVRPDEYANAEPEDAVAYKTMEDLIKTTGLEMQLTEPEEVATFALDGIQQGRFWLIPESERGDKMVTDRTKEILSRQNPVSAW
ncbi:SDR family NAD(P)-dependent oxidoreductase [Parasphingorhabdus sp. JC815]|uniref:SDR family NAD(P)-dependent oxidoreductase n=1 Tax=Parasphingorhabdus sp. JC815 TaxID=3232140 RepID=UPI003459EBCE